MSARRGIALATVLLVLLFLGAVLGGLPWLLKAESVSAREDLAAVRASLAADAAVALAVRYLEAAPPESLVSMLQRMPPPAHLAGGAIGFAELEQLDSATVEVVAQGFAGPRGIPLARRQRCALLTLGVESDSSGQHTVVRSRLPGAVVDC